MSLSEVAHIRKIIASEYIAAKWGLSGLASGSARHDFINAKLERMEEGHNQLVALIGEQEAAVIVADALVSLPEKPERSTLPDLLIYMRGNTEATAHLIDHIQEMWETIDLLYQEFGEEAAQKIMLAPGRALVQQS